MNIYRRSGSPARRRPMHRQGMAHKTRVKQPAQIVDLKSMNDMLFAKRLDSNAIAATNSIILAAFAVKVMGRQLPISSMR